MTRTHAPHDGSLLASGLVVHASREGVRDVARVAALLRPGDSALASGADTLVLFAADRRVRTEHAAGDVVVRVGTRLVAFACAPSALTAHPGDALLRLVAGEVVATPLAALSPVSAAELFCTDPFRVREVTPLGPAPATAKLAAPRARAVREILGIPESEEQRAFVASLATTRPTKPTLRDRVTTSLRGLLGLLGRRVRAWAQRPRRALPASTGTAARRASARTARPSLLDTLISRLTRALAVLERLTGRQARYIEALLDQLERGDYESALRRAIPLGGGAGAAEPRIELGVPSARAELRIEPRPRDGTGTVIPVGDDLQRILRERYEHAFGELDRAGKHEEAAFVLAELLRAHTRAVEYLEKHERYALAAELAEANGVSAEWTVALYFLARRVDRAISVARRTGAFSAAILRLERTQRRDAADALRLEHADLRAHAGDYLGAVEIAWRVPAARRLVRTWLDLLIDAGGTPAARGWARLLALDPLDADGVRTRLLPELSREDEDGAWFREAFATQACLEALSPLGLHALKRAYRGLLTDRLASGRPLDDLVKRVATKLADPVLAADTPSLSLAIPRLPSGPVRLNALDAGTMRVHDAITLPDGRLLVALGENGVRIVGRSGKTELTFAQPANGLVLDDHGHRAIAVMPRADDVRLARIDLLARRAERFIDIRCRLVAGSFDGESLFVVQRERDGDALICLDAVADTPCVLHAVRGLRPIEDIGRSATALSVLLEGADVSQPLDFMRFELPSRTLRVHREATPTDRAYEMGNAVPGIGSSYFTTLLGLSTIGDARHLDLDDPDDETVVVETSGEATRDVLVLEGGAYVTSMRAHGDFVTVADSRGRVVTLDRTTLAVVRITPIV